MRPIILVGLLLSLAAPAGSSTQLAGPTGFCTFTSRAELRRTTGIAGRSMVTCRYPGPDVTGDGVLEVIEMVALVKRSGAVDCARSTIAVLDVTLERRQAVAVTPACP